MSATLGSEVHAVWSCTECMWIKETVTQFEAGREWLKWSAFEEDHRPQHHCQKGGKPYLRFLQWME